VGSSELGASFSLVRGLEFELIYAEEIIPSWDILLCALALELGIGYCVGMGLGYLAMKHERAYLWAHTARRQEEYLGGKELLQSMQMEVAQRVPNNDEHQYQESSHSARLGLSTMPSMTLPRHCQNLSTILLGRPNYIGLTTRINGRSVVWERKAT
jgi:hypothetical protein